MAFQVSLPKVVLGADVCFRSRFCSYILHYYITHYQFKYFFRFVLLLLFFFEACLPKLS